MADKETIREYARRHAEACVSRWATEGWYELNDVWYTDFSEAELLEIAELASKAQVAIPND